MAITKQRESLYGTDNKADIIQPPDLLEIQKNSFEQFVRNGIREELKNISPILAYGGKYEMEFLDDYVLEKPGMSFEQCQKNEVTYSAPLKVKVRLTNTEKKEVVEQDVFMSEIPLISDNGSFLINGAERVVVSQFVRSPGVYFRYKPLLNSLKTVCSATVIPNRGAWLEIEADKDDYIFVLINKLKKFPITVFLSALGYKEAEIKSANKDHAELIAHQLEKSPMISRDEAVVEIYKKLRPGDPVTVDGAKALLKSLFFDPGKYDLSNVGRHRVNKRLDLQIDINTVVVTNEDVMGIIKVMLNLMQEDGITDDIDHLGNRRIRSVGEHLQKQFRIGLARLDRLIREQIALKASENLVPQTLINIRPLVAAMREFFGSSQLSQFMDQTNPLAEMAHERRLSALGPGGLTKERAGFEVRDIHPSHYGRICPIETPEGPNAGLIGPLATFARVNEYGFIETPYRKIVKNEVTDEIVCFTADIEENYYIAAWDAPRIANKFKNKFVVARYQKQFLLVPAEKIQFIGVSSKQLVGVSCGLIPFLEHDDANRALMGANMQRQAVPLMHSQTPHVGTGLEKIVARDAGITLKARQDGVVEKVSGQEITLKTKSGKDTYTLKKFERTNQNTTRNQRTVVQEGDTVKSGELLADGTSSKNGELSLGKNILVAFMPWGGYNFEDAIVISERLAKEDVFTSIHILKHEIDIRTTKLGPEEITREIPNMSEDALKNLDENGVIRVGAIVKSGDILVGKVTPKGETEPPAEEKLLRAIFGDKARDMRDTSLRVSSGDKGKVIAVKVLSRDTDDSLPPGVNYIVRIYTAQIRKISIGDKMAGRHGNKGVISTILPVEDMPFMPNGEPVDIILNPLGVPSRMNVGQLFETMLGFAGHVLKEDYEVQLFDEILGSRASVNSVEKKLEDAAKIKGYEWVDTDGKVMLRDGKSGKPFDRKVTVGSMYMLKLNHLVDDKIHARSTGPYSLVTQQPLGGKAQYGGQRFGEMEVWALEAYGAAYTLQEILTIKSDDLTGRAKAYESIIKGKCMNKPGTPESFRVLLRELRSIALDIKVLSKDKTEIDNR
eukprot:COSAG01_NODE_1_length_100484_cov_170.446142_98_plen_1068_part_00